MAKSNTVCGRLAWTVVFLTLAAGLLSGSVSAQVTTADLTGTVTETSSAILKKAKVSLRNTATQETRTTASSDAGTYTFTLLNPGTYAVEITVSGFKTFVSQVSLSAGDRARFDAKMSVGAESATEGGNLHL